MLRGFAGNITAFGPQFLDYVKEACSSPDSAPMVLAINETHVGQAGALDAQAKMAKNDFTTYWTPASATGAGGLAGGTMVAVKSWISSSHLGAAPGQALLDPMALALPDFTPVVLRLECLTFLLVSVYLTSSIGLTGSNVSKLATLAAWLKAYGLPYICVGDWNVPPAVLARHPWLSMVEGHIILPDNASTTCSAGGGALLDYVVASADMKAWLAKLEARYTPWKPHMSLAFEIAAPAKPVLNRVLVSPVTPSLPQVKRVNLMGVGQMLQGCRGGTGAQHSQQVQEGPALSGPAPGSREAGFHLCKVHHSSRGLPCQRP